MKFSEYEAFVASGQKTEVGDSSVPKQARPFQGHRAGLVTRALAALIDLGLVALTVIALNAIAAIVRFLVVRTSGLDIPHLQWSIILGAGFLWSSWTWGWALTGRTFGGHIMGLRVVSRSVMRWAGQPPRFGLCFAWCSPSGCCGCW